MISAAAQMKPQPNKNSPPAAGDAAFGVADAMSVDALLCVHPMVSKVVFHGVCSQLKMTWLSAIVNSKINGPRW
jgi:hypothetical protein